MALEKTGLIAVIQNAQNFLREARQVEDAQKKIGESAKKAAKDSGSLDAALKSRQKILSQTIARSMPSYPSLTQIWRKNLRSQLSIRSISPKCRNDLRTLRSSSRNLMSI